MLVSMAIIPLMVRNAAALGMIDLPDPRKVHKAPIPRVGGVGIVLGAMVSILLIVNSDSTVAAYLMGATVLFVFGIWDDVKELGHYVKFIGQFFAATALVFYGDLYVMQFPIIGAIPEWFGKPFSVIAIVGVINAINHSDGLDGLAGGESLLSLAVLGYFFQISDSTQYLLITLATIGGIFGFLRFNSHPARVFMGDGGSQFIGYTLAFLVLALTQRTNTAVSPAIPLLLVGLPIIDILSVLYQRVRGGNSWFKATRNHIHHRLLDLGFHHYAVVSIIYSVQALLVVTSLVLAYEYDALHIGIYLAVCVSLFAILIQAEKHHLKVADSALLSHRLVPEFSKLGPCFIRWSNLLLMAVVPTLLLLSSTLVTDVGDTDMEVVSMLLLALLLASIWMEQRLGGLLRKAVVFIALAFVVYLSELHGYFFPWVQQATEIFVFGAIFVALPIRLRMQTVNFFKVSPLDYLLVLVILMAGLVHGYEENPYIIIAVKLAILFYCVEWVLFALPKSERVLALSTGLSLLLIGGRLFLE